MFIGVEKVGTWLVSKKWWLLHRESRRELGVGRVSK